MLIEYRNEPFGDFSGERQPAMQRALREVGGTLGQTYPIVIGGEAIMTDNIGSSFNPAKPRQLVGAVAQADAELARRAVEVAHASFPAWSRLPVEERARVVLRASAIMRRRRLELAAWMVYEVSKTWGEADADVAEAIDFCELYAREALRLQGREQPLLAVPGEQNELRHIPLGAGLAIPPWNFALAIMVGLTVAPLVAGNTVVLKPSERSPVIAALFFQILQEAGVPPGVVNFLPGVGSQIGDVLVDHPRTRFIGFTGSKAVGLRINERASVRQPGQLWIKRAILEMGGKDAQVVDETADLDAAAEAIVAAAFGFQGQKCSACSRAIVVEDVYEPLLQKVVERARRLNVGDPALPQTNLGAVIDKQAFDSISSYIALGNEEARLVLGGEVIDHTLLEDGGFFIMPTIFADVKPDSRLAQEEIFGPVLSYIKARDFDEALEIANNTEYGLTGGLFSNDIARLQRARDELHVGNLYLNRKITGALVGVQPFGGFNMSGTDSKAGGPDYVALFTQAKVIAERL